MAFPESDWRLLRVVHRAALDRYCAGVLAECAETIQEVEFASHERYLRLFRLLKDHDESVANAFNDLRRSTALQRLASMIALGVVTDEELGGFSVATRDSAVALADILRPRERARKSR